MLRLSGLTCPGCDDIQHVARTKGLQLFCVGGGALWVRASSAFPLQQHFPRCDFFETVHVLTVQNFSGTFLHTCHTIVSWNFVEMVLKPSHQSSHPHAKVHMLWQDLLERCKISHPFFCIISSIPIVHFGKKKFLEETPLLWLQQSPFTDWVLKLENLKQFEDYGKSLFLTSDLLNTFTIFMFCNNNSSHFTPGCIK